MDEKIRLLEERMLAKCSKLKSESQKIELLFLFYDDFVLHALDIIDKNQIKICKSQNGLKLFLVNSSSASRHYVCLKGTNNCSCLVHKYSVIKGRVYCCKHVIAANIYEVFVPEEKLNIETVSESTFNEYLRQFHKIDTMFTE